MMNKKSPKLLLMLSALTLVLVFQASPTETYAVTKVTNLSGTYVVTANALNVRSGAGTNFKKVGLLPRGKKIVVNGKTSNGWYRLKHNGKTAFASGKYLKSVNTSNKKTGNTRVSNASGTYTVTATTLNVRSGAGTNYKKIALLKKGNQVNVTGKTPNGWHRITIKGKTGYVSSKYLKAYKPSSNQSKSKTNSKKNSSIKVSNASGLYTVTANALNVRSGNGTKYKTIGSLKKNSKVQVTGKTSNNWFRINYKGKVGYISGSYIKKQAVTKNGSQTKHKPEVKPTYIKGVLIVNKKYPLPFNYAPGESSKARQAFNLMKNDGKKNGFNLMVFSGYRTYSYQKQLYERYVAQDGKAAADRYSARPGHSEHQTGLAFDIGEVGKESTWFSETPATHWMAKNAHKYGFIVRYQKGKEHITGYKYEPWHLRYLGKDLATKVYKSGLTLEEYLGIN